MWTSPCKTNDTKQNNKIIFMKHNIYKYGIGCLLGIAAISLASCNDDDDMAILDAATTPSSITFNLPNELSQLIYADEAGTKCLPLIKGEQVKLEYTLLPEDATFKNVVWTSSNENVATVDDQGTVNAVSSAGLGYSMIQVAPLGVFSGSGINDVLKVVVSETMIPAETITVTASAEEVYGGDDLQMTATIAPANSTYKTVKWASSNESVATIDANGVLKTKDISSLQETVTVTATALDGSNVSASKQILVKKLVQPQEVTLDQKFSADNGYFCALNEQSLNLDYTTVPAQSTTSLLQWTSSDDKIATVENGKVIFKNFGEVTITATCPETGKSSSVKLNIPCGLIRETYHNPDHYSFYNAKQSGNGTSSSHEWHDGYITVTTYKQNATNQRADIKCWEPKVFLHAGNYPIIAIKVDDVKDMGYGISSRNLNFDVVGKSESGKDFKALGSGNNKYSSDYKCSDGSHVFIYDLAKVSFGTGGIAPTNESIEFSVFQLKYADMKTIDHQIQYNIYWFQTFKNLDEVGKYIESEGLTYDVIK